MYGKKFCTENKVEIPTKFLDVFFEGFTDTGEDSKLVHRRKRPKVDTLYPSLFSDASERGVRLIAESKILASTFGRFRLYRLNLKIVLTIGLSKPSLFYSNEQFNPRSVQPIRIVFKQENLVKTR